MGTVYAIANQKGGVGKTTTAVNVAACIAEAGYATLLVDIDPQANATVGLGHRKDARAERLRRPRGEATATRRPPDGDRRASICCRRTPTSPARTSSCRASPGSEHAPARRARAVRDRFAFMLLDCPPSLGPLTVNALVAADRVIVPVQTEYFALEGLAGLLDTLALVQRELNPRLAVAGMLLTMHDGRTRLGAGRRARGARALPGARLRHRDPAQRARSARRRASGVPVIHHDPHCAGAEAYFELAKEVAARG